MHEEIHKDLVLVGGGHAHVQVIRRWMMAPLAGVRLCVVLDRPDAVYSGMVPACVSGELSPSELEIDVVPLARRAGARVVLARAIGIDPVRRRIEVEGRPPIAYDVASLDFGATVRGLELPGVALHALSTRPIRHFVDRLPEKLAKAQRRRPGEALRVVVVGGGAAGIELAFTLQTRIAGGGSSAKITLLCGTSGLLNGEARSLSRRVQREAAQRDVEIRSDAEVTRVHEFEVEIGEKRLPFDLLVWATGAAPLAAPRVDALPTDEAGFVRSERTLQVSGHEDLFAVGDCAALADAPWVRKAGVYAVRAGPVLDHNLRARLQGRRLRRFRPQRHFLSLLNLGDGRAIASKWGLHASGRWVWRWKDRIDRRFMRLFQVLEEDGSLAAEFPDPVEMGMKEMACGGCAAKLEASSLESALSRLDPAPPDDSVVLGLSRPDDAAAIRLPGGALQLVSVDAFRAFSDDPWLVGQVAAVNAVSDVLAKGGRPRHAMALVTVPEEAPERAEETLYQVLAGVRAALDPLSISLVGGHTTLGPELFVGMSVSGDLEDGQAPLPLSGLRPGDQLILTKALGTGVVMAADMQGRARGEWVQSIVESLVRMNDHAARVARGVSATACTDISGFGLARHLAEMLRASDASAAIHLDSLPVLPGARDLLERGVRSTYHEQNALARRGIGGLAAIGDRVEVDLLFDPQTSGGLLFGVAENRVEETLAALREGGDEAAARIGSVGPVAEGGVRLNIR